MAEQGADAHILTSLDDIGWLLNLRGRDVEYFPLLLSYVIVEKDRVELYADERKFSEEIQAGFAQDGITVFPYNDIYARIKNLKAESVLLDRDRVNYSLYPESP